MKGDNVKDEEGTNGPTTEDEAGETEEDLLEWVQRLNRSRMLLCHYSMGLFHHKERRIEAPSP